MNAIKSILMVYTDGSVTKQTGWWFRSTAKLSGRAVREDSGA